MFRTDMHIRRRSQHRPASSAWRRWVAGAVACIALVDGPSARANCPSGINEPDRIRADHSLANDPAERTGLCPQIVNEAIDVANTNPDFPINGRANPFWDPAAVVRAEMFFPFDYQEANVNIMELVAPEVPSTLSPGDEFKVYVRQRCLAQQMLAEGGAPIRNDDGNQRTTPLCVSGYQFWLRFDPAIVEALSVDVSPTAARHDFVFANTPFSFGIIASIDNTTGRIGAAAGVVPGAAEVSDDVVIAVVRFRARDMNGKADIRFDASRIFGQNPNPATNPPIRWSRDLLTRDAPPVYPNLHNALDIEVIDDPNDRDGDGVVNDEDNCIETANPNQSDGDGDGFGDRCDPDLDNDCQVWIRDLLALANSFGAAQGSPRYKPACDLDGDGLIGPIDLNIFMRHLHGAPGPSATATCP